MPDVIYSLVFNPNSSKSGKVTLDELLAKLQGQNVPAEAADPIFDAEGKLTAVDVHLPATGKGAADGFINGNPGIAINSGGLPQELTVRDLTNMVLAATTLDTAQQVFGVSASDSELSTALNLGRISGPANAFVDGSVNGRLRLRPHTIFIVTSSDPANAMSIPAGDLTLTFAGPVGALVVDNAGAIALPVSTGGRNDIIYFMDASRKIYEAERFENGVLITARRNFSASVAAGAK